MLGLLTDHHSYKIRTDIPILIESLDLYKNTPSLIPERFVSLSTKFGICSNSDNLTQCYPIFPNEELENCRLSNGDEFCYAITSNLKRNYSIFHFRILCDKIGNYYFNSSDHLLYQNLQFVVLIDNQAIFFQTDKSTVHHFQIFSYEQELELLFHLNRFFIQQGMDLMNEKIILLGEVEPKFKIFNLFQNYCKNILADDFNPLSLLEL